MYRKNEDRKKNYAKTRVGNFSRFVRYTPEEDRQVLARNISDRELSKALGRSAQSIQLRRTRIKKNETNAARQPTVRS